MRNRIFGKLHSRRGASFLLALLFFLICALVASAVLMAAASNAGRIRSARTEHQLYLTVSSAARLLCDELTDCEYRGRYYYERIVTPIYGPDGQFLYNDVDEYLWQEEGVYQYAGSDESAKLASLLLDDFDYIFSKEFDKVTNMEKVTKLSLTSPTPHTLTITPEEAAGEALTEPVTLTLTVNPQNYTIDLTAEQSGYIIRAQLAPSSTQPNLPPSFQDGVTAETDPMTWHVSWITPGEAAGEEGSGGA